MVPEHKNLWIKYDKKGQDFTSVFEDKNVGGWGGGVV